MGKHTGLVSGSSYSQCTQQPARCCERLTWSRSTRRLVVCHSPVSWRHTGFWIQSGRQRQCFFFSSFFFFASPFQIPGYEEALGLLRLGTITQLSNTSLLIITWSLKNPVWSAGWEEIFWQVRAIFFSVLLICWKHLSKSIRLNRQSLSQLVNGLYKNCPN